MIMLKKNKLNFILSQLENSYNFFYDNQAELSSDYLFSKNKTISNLFGQTMIFQTSSTSGKKGLFGYGSSLKKNYLEIEDKNISFYYGYFNINDKNLKNKKIKKEKAFLNIYSSLYKKKKETKPFLLFKDPAKETKETKETRKTKETKEIKKKESEEEEEKTLEGKQTPYSFFKNKIKEGKDSYQIINKNPIYSFYPDDLKEEEE